MTAVRNTEARSYAKPVVVPERLELLQGPTSGVVKLPRHLKWSGNARYDLAEPGRIVDLYRTVINEAATPSDLYVYIDTATLAALWPTMWLPAPVRRVWEQCFPELARLRSSTTA
ncbi:hypothetical protein Psuf_042800 [Phytohabitans suffuscus]|uniref:Uncharacterized protein n=1 Tax=Phytohabitans suffuscus TaxID=624315 RepID=A0A6F8YLL6_9ACTN|nr:hypothetical protein Psuf_042800 [Phytohabitans suffuscus]